MLLFLHVLEFKVTFKLAFSNVPRYDIRKQHKEAKIQGIKAHDNKQAKIKAELTKMREYYHK